MNCSVCNSPSSFDTCGNECGTIYCGDDCANADWPVHHAECEAIGRNWIQKMHMKKGAFMRQAQRHHESVSQYKRDVLKKGSHASATTKRRAQLAKTLGKMRHKK